jgi:Zn-dependent peptidase ImmA (M78 family)
VKIKLANDVFLYERNGKNLQKKDGYLEVKPEKESFIFNIYIKKALSPAEKFLVLIHELEHLSQAMNCLNKEVFSEKAARKMSEIKIKAMIQYAPMIIGATDISTWDSPKKFINAMSKKEKKDLSIIIKTIDIEKKEKRK